MNLNLEFDMNIDLCYQLKEWIEADCYVGMNELGGDTLLAYEEARKTQLFAIKQIYASLLALRETMNDIQVN